MDIMEKKPTSYVVAKFGCNRSTAVHWAKANGVELLGKMYFWSEDDIVRFANRPKPGTPPGKPRKKIKKNENS
jgi:hypothetical protein